MRDAGEHLTRAVFCLFYGIGIVGMLLLYGLWQERIMAYPYDGEYFTGSAFLVLFNRVFGVVFALVMALVMAEDTTCTAPLWKYTFISVTAVGASICQYEALKYVSFTVQMLGKSCKMFPVMLWGMAMSGKRYGLIDWATSICVTGGVAEFLLTGSIAADTTQGTSLRGLLMLLAFVALDGFTSTFQEKLFQDYMTSKYNQMFYINLASAGITVIMLLISGQTAECFTFLGRHPTLIGDASLLSASAVAAQWFIYSQVQEYGALVFAATMNARQVISILASYLAYRHPISPWQILGLIVVGLTLFGRSIVGLWNEQQEQRPLLTIKTEEVPKKPEPGSRLIKKTTTGCCPSWKV
mmetsp:Transcript_113220/g.365858  ORF Transcript_113220/g.365858 Transcript_113220/m.365858 type:complete len:354 (+) Transcript_113220:77-1138(+)